MKKRGFGSNLFDCINVLLILVLAVITLYPFLHVLFASLSDSALLVQHRGILLWPKGFSLASYQAVLSDSRIFIGYKNTLIVLVGGLTINMILSCLAAFCLSRKNMLFGGFMAGVVTMTMFVNGGLVPTFLVVKGLGLIDSYWALILPVAINAYNVIILRTAFASVPDSLVEAAVIDGAKEWRILLSVIIPLSMPTISVIILYYAVAHWNSWFNATIYIRDANKVPLQVVLRDILLQNDTNNESAQNATRSAKSVSESIKYATVIVTIVPVLLVYPALQKYFTRGVMIGAVKG